MTSGDPLWSGGAGSPPPPSQPPQFVKPEPPPNNGRNAWQRLPKWAQWSIGVFAGLVVLSALVPADDKKQDTQTIAQVNGTSAATTKPVAATPASTPEPTPTPDPEVSISYSGPSTVRKDEVTLKGTVDPANANIRIKGKKVKARKGRWSLPVTLTKKGDSNFRVVATRKGYVKFTDTITVTRKLSAAERAAIRKERAERRAMKRREEAAARAGARALESAESYLSNSAFSKKGLYEQLLYEEFTESEAQYAVDHVDADWKEQAVEAAKSYLSHSSFSKQGLIEQLIYEGYTPEQASYGVDKAY